MLDQRHEFLLQTIADCLDLSVEEATDALLEGTQVITLIYMYIYMYMYMYMYL